MDLVIQALVYGVLIGIVYALIAMGLTIIFGVMKIVNFAHGEMVVIGMYLGYFGWTQFGLSGPVSAIGAAAILFCAGYLLQRFLVNRFTTRPQYVQFILFIAIAFIITGVHTMLFGSTPLSISPFETTAVYEVWGLRIQAVRAEAAASALVLIALLTAFLRYSETGKAIRAAADNQTGAAVIGLRVPHIYAVTAGVGMACAGAAGAMIMPVLSVEPSVAPAYTLIAFIVVIIGGLGSLAGALAGGILIGVAESLAAIVPFLPSSAKSMFSYGLLILVILIRPQGIFGRRAGA